MGIVFSLSLSCSSQRENTSLAKEQTFLSFTIFYTSTNMEMGGNCFE